MLRVQILVQVELLKDKWVHAKDFKIEEHFEKYIYLNK